MTTQSNGDSSMRSWLFIGELLRNLNAPDSALSLGGQVIPHTDLIKMIPECPLVSGFTGIYLSVKKDRAGEISIDWRVLRHSPTGNPQEIRSKAFSILKYGYEEAFKMAVHQRAEFLGIDLNYPAPSAPAKSVALAYLSSRIDGDLKTLIKGYDQIFELGTGSNSSGPPAGETAPR